MQKAYEPAFSRRVLIDSYAAEHTAEQIWVALFEALNWLDALCLHPEAAPRIDPKLKDALRFVRGRVHHAFGDAIEFRDDVPLPLGPVGVGLGSKRPVLITDWCWSDAADLPGGKRASSAASRDRSGETATKRFWLVCRSARPSIRSRSLPQKFTTSLEPYLFGRAARPVLGSKPGPNALKSPQGATPLESLTRPRFACTSATSDPSTPNDACPLKMSGDKRSPVQIRAPRLKRKREFAGRSPEPPRRYSAGSDRGSNVEGRPSNRPARRPPGR
jgi:hypothetical protein